MKLLLILLMLAPACGFGQTKAPARPARKTDPAKSPTPAAALAAKYPIATLDVEGNRNYTSEQVLAVAGLKVGQVVGKAEFEAAHDRLVATGAFETVSYRFAPDPNGNGYAAAFRVTEVDTLPVRFQELGVPDSDIEGALHARDSLFSVTRLAASRPVINRHTAWIQEYLATRGITEKIAGGVAPWPDKLAVVFRPAKNLPAVAQVTFEGNLALSEDALREAIAGVAVGAAYTEERFRDLLDSSVRPLYEAHGRLRVAFPRIRTEPATDVAGVHVFVTVEEGDDYNLGKVAIAGPAPLRPQDLIKAGEFKTGETADFDRVKEGLEKMRKALRHAGYLDAQVTAVRDVHDAEKTVDLALRVDAGSQYVMGKLTVAGLDLTGEAEINRIWSLKEGKPFDAEYPDYFLARVREQGMFDNLGETKAETKVDEQKHTVDVTLRFGGAAEGKGPERRRGGQLPR
jgi:outer membrane protein insertion porin family